MVVSVEVKAEVSMYFVKRLPIIRTYRFPKFVAGRGHIQSVAITSHRPETAMGSKGGFEWWTSLLFWVQETQDLIQKYMDFRRSYVLLKPRWSLVKWSWHQCKSSICRVYSSTN